MDAIFDNIKYVILLFGLIISLLGIVTAEVNTKWVTIPARSRNERITVFLLGLFAIILSIFLIVGIPERDSNSTASNTSFSTGDVAELLGYPSDTTREQLKSHMTDLVTEVKKPKFYVNMLDGGENDEYTVQESQVLYALYKDKLDEHRLERSRFFYALHKMLGLMDFGIIDTKSQHPSKKEAYMIILYS